MLPDNNNGALHMDKASTGEIAGLSSGSVAVRIHRINISWGAGFAKELRMSDSLAGKIRQSQPAESNQLRLDQIQMNASKRHVKTRQALYRHLAARLLVIACCGTGIALASHPSQRAAFVAPLLWALAGLYAVHRGMGRLCYRGTRL
jgi:hypothetical protein